MEKIWTMKLIEIQLVNVYEWYSALDAPDRELTKINMKLNVGETKRRYITYNYMENKYDTLKRE